MMLMLIYVRIHKTVMHSLVLRHFLFTALSLGNGGRENLGESLKVTSQLPVGSSLGLTLDGT